MPEVDYIGTPKDHVTEELLGIFDEDDLRFTPSCLKEIKDRLLTESQEDQKSPSSAENEQKGQQQLHTPEQLV
ncbi:unnamed protein product [Ambrosiozyma monospora]|uniref:Unnamed protein product n=1 Tax=Ambrosiozyma monospora TaxID=43982 RepID=A0ACB5TJY3_AMBMO|nr:unnamed protein product [Ambrosiozyma monospora]